MSQPVVSAHQPQPRILRLEQLITQLLLGHGYVKGNAIAYTHLAGLMVRTPAGIKRAVDRLVKLGVIAHNQTGQISLTPEGVRRTQWSQILGVRAIIGVGPEQQIALTALGSTPRHAYTLDELRKSSGCPDINDRHIAHLRNGGLAFDARDVYAPGTNQPSQWVITPQGRMLLACVAGDQAPSLVANG